MDSIRKNLRKLPPGAVIKVLRKVFAYPAPAARMILNDITRPRKSHKPWIHKVPWNQAWSGCWIGEQVYKLDEIALKRRIDQADIVFFNVHGNILARFPLITHTPHIYTYIACVTQALILFLLYNNPCRRWFSFGNCNNVHGYVYSLDHFSQEKVQFECDDHVD